jgi:hypothetical protein
MTVLLELSESALDDHENTIVARLPVLMLLSTTKYGSLTTEVGRDLGYNVDDET